MIENNIVSPWFKQFWPWFLIAFPAIAVVAGFATLYFAIESNDGLVNDDYYKQGLAINQVLERDKKAAELALHANASWDQQTQIITLKLSGKLQPLPQRLLLTASHPTRAHFDQRIQLYLSPDKLFYSGRSHNIKSGNWITYLEPDNNDWRISGRIKLPEQSKWEMQ